jgi:hypothetical protein
VPIANERKDKKIEIKRNIVAIVFPAFFPGFCSRTISKQRKLKEYKDNHL